MSYGLYEKTLAGGLGFVQSPFVSPTEVSPPAGASLKWWHLATGVAVVTVSLLFGIRWLVTKYLKAAAADALFTWPLFLRLLLYLISCIYLGFLWYGRNPNDWIVAIATALSIFLAAGAIDLAIAHRLGLVRVESLIRSSFGLEDYIQKASEMYKSAGVDRVVTSLRHWVARGEPATWIERGVMDSSAKELVFIGTINWDVYYPGVLWRFATLREIIQKRERNGDNHIPAVRIVHVEAGAPLFVVSKRSTPTPTDRGSLLLGNPMKTAATNLYGINLGSNHPKQVDHYNFVFDTLMSPPQTIQDVWETIKTATGIAEPFRHQDAMSQLFSIKPFGRGGEIYSREEGIPKSHIRDALVKAKSRWIGSEIQDEIDSYPKRKEEEAFLPARNEIEDWAEQFLNALCDQNILSAVDCGDGNSDEITCAEFKLGSQFNFDSNRKKLPTCEDFFRSAKQTLPATKISTEGAKTDQPGPGESKNANE